MTNHDLYISFDLIEALKAFPVEREVLHCDSVFYVSPFDFYAACPKCGRRVKLRSQAAAAELEDVFEAVFEWLAQPAARAFFEKRRNEIRRDQTGAESQSSDAQINQADDAEAG